MAVNFGGGTSLGTPTLPFLNQKIPVGIQPAQVYMVPPGAWVLESGFGYASLEFYESATGMWRPVQNTASGHHYVDSDGGNYRIINRTGCPTGAIITNVGSSYTSAPTVVSSAGGSTWTAIVGGSINTTVTTTTAGTYNYIPTLIFDPPPAGGVRAAGYVPLSGTGLGTVTVTNAGAGYTTAPKITIVPDPRETGAGGGVLTVNATLANSQAVTALICNDPGTAAQTSTPTLTFSGGAGGGAAATVEMNYAVTGFTVTNKGSSLGNSTTFLVTTGDYKTTATTALTDPQLDAGITNSRRAWLQGYTNSTGNAIASNTSLITIDGGWGFQQTPSLYIVPDFSASVAITSAVLLVATVGGKNDTWYLQRLGT